MIHLFTTPMHILKSSIRHIASTVKLRWTPKTGLADKTGNGRGLPTFPLLDEAAVTAVKQWIYEPFIVNEVAQGVI